MSKKLSKVQETKLSNHIGKLVDSIDEQIAGLRDLLAECNDHHGDQADAAQVEQDTNQHLRSITTLTETRNRLCAKFRAILYGNFDGLCEGCNEQIGFKRLVANPCAGMCIDCANMAEYQANKFRKPGMQIAAHA